MSIFAVTRQSSMCLVLLLVAIFLVSSAHGSKHMDDDNNNNNNNGSDKTNVLFIFAMGLEGTGHHLGVTLATHSPAVERAEPFRKAIAKAEQSLTHLWRAVDSIKGANYDVAQAHDDLVTNLANIQQQATATASSQQPLHVFLSLDGHTMSWSYPNGGGPERFLKYPDLDLLYAACDQAGVQCGHFYMYRDPHAVLHSTTIKRGFDKNTLIGMRLYTTLLNVMHSQLSAHAHRTLACWGFFDTEQTQATKRLMWNQVRDLFGWTAHNQTGFDAALGKFYHPPEPSSSTMVLTPSERVYMHSMQLAHNRTLALCRAQAQERQAVAGNA